MYLSDDELKKWGEYVNGIVGEESDKGAILAAEKTDAIEVKMAGSKEDGLEVLASCIYNFSKIHSMAFGDVLDEITATWKKIQDQNLIGHFGDEVIDLSSGIGINEEAGLVSLPVPPKDVMEQMQKQCEHNQAILDALTEKLSTEDDIYEFLDECTDAGIGVLEETGEKYITFVHDEVDYTYYPDDEVSNLVFLEGGQLCMLPYENELFRNVVKKIIEENE